MIIASILHTGGTVGVDELVLVLFLLVAALIALYLALRIPRLTEYQTEKKDQTEGLSKK